MVIINRLSVVVVVAIISALSYYFFYDTPQLEEVILKTFYGRLKGFKSLTRQGRIVNTFRAIPYAHPPVGALRFQPPVKYGKWEGIRDARVPVPICIQADTLFKNIAGQEDCLYLSVFTPKIPTNQTNDRLLPVIVQIHGGHFMFGSSGLFGPKYFLDEDIILVTLNYRVGALGFLNTGDFASGNMGLKDQVMALKWVQSTIKYFGGDPNQVTLIGNSAGGASVHYHMISPLSKGLFQRAISQSGTALCPWSKPRHDAPNLARRLGNKLRCIGTSSAELFKCINSTSGLNIVETQTECYDVFHAPEAIYGPSIEQDDALEAFLTETIWNSYTSGQIVSKIPWITGVNSEDGCYRSAVFGTDEERLDEIYKNWNSLAPDGLIYDKSNKEAAQKIFNYYFGKQRNAFTTNDYTALTNLFSDRYFLACTSQAAQFHAKHSDTYLYYFNYKGDISVGELLAASKGNYPVILELLVSFVKKFIYTKIIGWETFDFGACHADELRYLLYTIPFFEISENSVHFEFSKSLVKLWTSFATTGHPGKFRDTEWTKVDDHGQPRYLKLDNYSGRMIDEPFSERLRFWDTLEF